MFDLLAAAIRTDPAPLAAWALLLVAFAMYPLGLLLPGCACCGNPCGNCPTGEPPDTVTVTFPAWDDELPGQYRHRVVASPQYGFYDAAPAIGRVTATTPREYQFGELQLGGAITAVEVLDGGGPFAQVNEDSTVTVAAVNIQIENDPGYPFSATLSAVIDDDPESDSFGRVTAFTVTGGGTRHSYRELLIGLKCCKATFQSRAFVLTKNPENPCQWRYEACAALGQATITLTIPPAASPWGRQLAYIETLMGDGGSDGCVTRWTAQHFLDDCSTLEWNGAPLGFEAGARVATVTPGGTYVGSVPAAPASCTRCCSSGTLPDEISVDLTYDASYTSLTPRNGTYVLRRGVGPLSSYGYPSSMIYGFDGRAQYGDHYGAGFCNDWTQIQVQAQHCGQFAPNIWNTHDPVLYKFNAEVTSDMTMSRLAGLFGRQQRDVEVANWEKPATPPANPNDHNAAQPNVTITAPAVLDDYPGMIVPVSDDYVSYCGTDCTNKCFLVAAVLNNFASTCSGLGRGFEFSKPRGGTALAEPESGFEDYPARQLDAYRTYFSYFKKIDALGAWIWAWWAQEWQFFGNWPTLLAGDQGLWPWRSVANSPQLESSTCDACATLCSLTGRQIVIYSNDTGTPGPVFATITVQ